MIADLAAPIIAARMKGKKPADLVIVSLVGPVVSDNPVVFAKADQVYDWRWVRGLDVCVYMADGIDWQAILMDIARQRPTHLSLWDHAGQWGTAVYLLPRADDIGRPIRSWKFELDFVPWMDFQNADYIVGRTYQRDRSGMPHAVN